MRALASVQLGAVIWVAAIAWTELDLLERFRWPAYAVVWLPPILWALRTRRFGELLRQRPLVLFIVWSSWLLFSSTWSSQQQVGFAFGLFMVATALFSSWFAAIWGWPLFARTTALSLGLFFTVGTGVALIFGEPLVSDRFRGLADNPTAAGILALIALFTTVIGYADRPPVAAVLISISAATMYFANARTAILATVIGLAIIGFGRASSSGRLAMLAAGFVALLAVLAIAVADPSADELIVREPGAEAELASFNGRIQLWELATEAIQERPVVGRGLFSSRDLYGSFRFEGRLDWGANESHNLAIQTLVESGVIGLVLLVSAVGSLGAALIRSRSIRELGFGVALLVNAQTESMMTTPTVAWIVVLGLAGHHVAARSRPKSSSVVGFSLTTNANAA